MKKTLLLLSLISIITLAGCFGPIYPTGELSVKRPLTFWVGSSYDIEIKYPDTEGTIVTGWKDEKIEIIEGNDNVKVEGLTITCLKEGRVKVKVSATTVISEKDSKKGYKEKVYSREMNFSVVNIV